MNETVVVALVVSVVSPAIVSYLAVWQMRKTKHEDWARQDALDQRQVEAAERVARAMSDETNRADQRSAAYLEQQHEQTGQLNEQTGKLDQIHTLVNSNLTTQLEATLDARTAELTLMREVTALNKAAGREPSKEAVEAIERAAHRIEEMKQQLKERAEQTATADAQVAAMRESKTRVDEARQQGRAADKQNQAADKQMAAADKQIEAQKGDVAP